MDLVRDLTDNKVVDRNGREMGRVDRVVLELRAGQPPSVAMLEIGPAALGDRLHPTIGRWLAALELALGLNADRPLRIPLSRVLDMHGDVKVDLAFGETGAAALEQRLRRWVARVPRFR